MPLQTRYVVAVWDEDGEENTHVIPSNWVEKRGNCQVIRWPPKSNVTVSFLKGCAHPTEKWNTFACTKLGRASGEYFNDNMYTKEFYV